MRLTTVFIIAAIMQVSASGFAQRLTLNQKEVSLKQVFKEIKKQTGYDVMYTLGTVDDSRRIDARFSDLPLQQVMEKCLTGQDLEFTFFKTLVVIKKKDPGFLSKVKEALGIPILVTGRITDSTGMALPGASIKVKDKVTKTDSEGRFSISAEAGTVIMVSFVGYQTTTFKVTDDMGFQNVVLKVATGELQEVTVNTGYQTLPKERATGSFDLINEKKLNEQVGTNILDRLDGVASGILFPKNGATGSNNKLGFVIRGFNTIQGDQTPLVVVDNFPIPVDQISQINPNDVQSVTILKDAAAASIWGSKAGNGVVVITTKRGNFNQKMKVSFNSNIGIASKPDIYSVPVVSSSDYIDLEKMLFANGAYTGKENNYPYGTLTPVVELLIKARDGDSKAKADAETQINSLRNKDIRNDFSKYGFQPAINQQYSLGFNGGNDNMNYYISGGYDHNIDNTGGKYSRVSLNSRTTFKITNRLSLGAGLNFTQSNTSSGSKSGYKADSYTPYLSAADASGNPVGFAQGYRQGFIDTAGHGKLLDWNTYPLKLNDYTHILNKLTSVTANLELKYKLFRGLEIIGNYQYINESTDASSLIDQNGLTDVINTFTTISPLDGSINYGVPLGGDIRYSNSKFIQNNWRGQINYANFWGKNQFNMIAGGEVNQSKSPPATDAEFYGYTANPRAYTILNTFDPVPTFFGYDAYLPGSQPTISSEVTNRFVSVFANASYTYNNLYTLSASARRDASNVYGVKTNDKWKPLYSIGLSWNISGEKFYQFDELPTLKLRVTQGLRGSASSNSGLTTILYSGNPRNNLPGAQVGQYGDPNLRWEQTNTTNVALDFGTKTNMITGSIDLYFNKMKDLIGPTLIDPTGGVGDNNLLNKNVSNMKSHGIEVSINSQNIKGKFNWMTNFLFNYNTNTVTNNFNPAPYNSAYVQQGLTSIQGHSLYSIYTYKWAGLDAQTGNPIGIFDGQKSQDYEAILNNTNVNDLDIDGRLSPVVSGSLGNSFNYKGFTLNFNIAYELNYYFVKQSISYSGLLYNVIQGVSASGGYSDYAKRWQQSGDEKITSVPSFTYPSDANKDAFYGASTALVRKADNIRIQYINLSYAIDREKLKNLPVNQLNIYFKLSNPNIILWRANKDHIDPDNIYKAAPSKLFTIGLHADL